MINGLDRLFKMAYVARLVKFAQTGELTDFKLMCNGVSVDVHKCVVAAGCQYIDEVLTQSPECTTLDMTIHMKKSPDVMNLFLDFIYSGKIEANSKILQSSAGPLVLQIADRLGIDTSFFAQYAELVKSLTCITPSNYTRYRQVSEQIPETVESAAYLAETAIVNSLQHNHSEIISQGHHHNFVIVLPHPTIKTNFLFVNIKGGTVMRFNFPTPQSDIISPPGLWTEAVITRVVAINDRDVTIALERPHQLLLEYCLESRTYTQLPFYIEGHEPDLTMYAYVGKYLCYFMVNLENVISVEEAQVDHQLLSVRVAYFISDKVLWFWDKGRYFKMESDDYVLNVRLIRFNITKVYAVVITKRAVISFLLDYDNGIYKCRQDWEGVLFGITPEESDSAIFHSSADNGGSVYIDTISRRYTINKNNNISLHIQTQKLTPTKQNWLCGVPINGLLYICNPRNCGTGPHLMRKCFQAEDEMLLNLGLNYYAENGYVLECTENFQETCSQIDAINSVHRLLLNTTGTAEVFPDLYNIALGRSQYDNYIIETMPPKFREIFRECMVCSSVEEFETDFEMPEIIMTVFTPQKSEKRRHCFVYVPDEYRSAFSMSSSTDSKIKRIVFDGKSQRAVITPDASFLWVHNWDMQHETTLAMLGELCEHGTYQGNEMLNKNFVIVIFSSKFNPFDAQYQHSQIFHIICDNFFVVNIGQYNRRNRIWVNPPVHILRDEKGQTGGLGFPTDLKIILSDELSEKWEKGDDLVINDLLSSHI